MKLQRVIFSFSFLLLSIRLNAGQGMIMTLDAPIFKAKNWKSKVIQHARRGDLIYIHPKHFRDKKKKWEFEQSIEIYKNIRGVTLPEFPEELILEEEFLVTLDNNGRDAYVPSKFVKLIYNDDRERFKKLVPLDEDSTDYRPREPLPEGYPVAKNIEGRGIILAGLSTQDTKTYNFVSEVKTIKHGKNLQMDFIYLRNMSFNFKTNLFLGGGLFFATGSNKYRLQNTDAIQENRNTWGLGPFLLYDVFNLLERRISLFGSFYYHPYNEISIFHQVEDGHKRERTFTAGSFSGRVGALYQELRILPILDLVAGFSIKMNLPYTMRSDDEVRRSALWQEEENDYISKSFHGDVSFFLGIQSSI